MPAKVLRKVRPICMALPDAYEEEAWVGTRWRVRQRTFAHVLTVEGGADSAHTRAAPRSTGPPRSSPSARPARS